MEDEGRLTLNEKPMVLRTKEGLMNSFIDCKRIVKKYLTLFGSKFLTVGINSHDLQSPRLMIDIKLKIIAAFILMDFWNFQNSTDNDLQLATTFILVFWGSFSFSTDMRTCTYVSIVRASSLSKNLRSF